jgi:hypothetical protein
VVSQNYDQTVSIELDSSLDERIGKQDSPERILGRPAAEAVWLRLKSSS